MKQLTRMGRNLACAALVLAGGTALACADNAYYPMVEGASWTYSGNDGTSFTQSILRVGSDSVTVQMDMPSAGMDGPMEMEFMCTEDGLLSFANMQSFMPEGMEVEVVSTDGVTYPSEWVVGHSWTSQVVMRMDMTMEGMAAVTTMTMDSINTLLPHESVTVPAGTFNALRMDSDMDMLSVTAMMGMEVPVSFASKSSTWLAEGVGMVRNESDDGSVLELVSYTIP